MSEEKECKCCHEWWYASDIKDDLCPNCYDYFKQLKQQLAQQKEMWETLKNFIVNRLYYAGYDVQEHGMKVITDIIDKMQELEGEK